MRYLNSGNRYTGFSFLSLSPILSALCLCILSRPLGGANTSSAARHCKSALWLVKTLISAIWYIELIVVATLCAGLFLALKVLGYGCDVWLSICNAAERFLGLFFGPASTGKISLVCFSADDDESSCSTIAVDSCQDLIKEVGFEAVQIDPACRAQCPDPRPWKLFS